MSEPFRLIETMRWDGKIDLLQRHMKRLQRSAEFFGISLDPGAVERALDHAISLHSADTGHPDPSGSESGPVRVRLTVDGLGLPQVSLRPIPAVSVSPRRVAISESRIDSDNVFRRHKSSRRQLYDAEYARASAAGLFEVLYLNEKGRVAEGSRTNIFVERGTEMLTPPVADGALPGVFRSVVLDTDVRAREESLEVRDLENADSLFVCNAVIGLVGVELIDSFDLS